MGKLLNIIKDKNIPKKELWKENPIPTIEEQQPSIQEQFVKLTDLMSIIRQHMEQVKNESQRNTRE